MSLTRRNFMIGAGAAGALAATGLQEAEAAASGLTLKQQAAYFGPVIQDSGVDFRSTNFRKINARWRRQFVPYESIEPQGSVVIDASNHFLYVIFENQTALRYGVGVGRDGLRE